MTLDKMNEIEDDILQLDKNATVVYCENDIDINWDLIQDEGKNEFRNKGEVRLLRQNYRRVLKWSHLNVEAYDFTKGDEPKDIYNKMKG